MLAFSEFLLPRSSAGKLVIPWVCFVLAKRRLNVQSFANSTYCALKLVTFCRYLNRFIQNSLELRDIPGICRRSVNVSNMSRNQKRHVAKSGRKIVQDREPTLGIVSFWGRRGPRRRTSSRAAWSNQTLQGSFSAVSKPTFATKYAFESFRRDLRSTFFRTALK